MLVSLASTLADFLVVTHPHTHTRPPQQLTHSQAAQTKAKDLDDGRALDEAMTTFYQARDRHFGQPQVRNDAPDVD